MIVIVALAVLFLSTSRRYECWARAPVLVPRSDAVSHYDLMTGAQFINAVALGQITPGPVVQTVAVVGYAAAGLIGGILASVVAFSSCRCAAASRSPSCPRAQPESSSPLPSAPPCGSSNAPWVWVLPHRLTSF